MVGVTDCRVGDKPLLAMTVEMRRVGNIGHSEGVSPWESVLFFSPGRRGKEGRTDCRVGDKPLLAMTVEIGRVENFSHSEGVSPWESVSPFLCFLMWKK